MSLSTEISPTVPSALGNSITRLLPISSTVMLNAVPRTPIRAVGVCMSTFCLAFLAILPDAYLTVPSPTFILSLLFLGSAASYMKSSMTNLLCFSICTLVSSLNPMPIIPSAVLIVSSNSTGRSFSTVILSSERVSCAGPVCFSTVPIPAKHVLI